MKLLNLIDHVYSPIEVSDPTESPAIDVSGCSILSLVIRARIAEELTFDTIKSASSTAQGLTLTAQEPGVPGNSISYEFIDPEEINQSLAITVTEQHIEISLATDGDGLVTTDVDALVTAINGDMEANDLVQASGDGSAPVTAEPETFLEGGAESDVNLADSTIRLPDHGYWTGLELELDSEETLPAPLETSTPYYAIVFDRNRIQLAASEQDALDGIFIEITDDGTPDETNDVIPTTVSAASVQLEKSYDGINWESLGSAFEPTQSGTSVEEVNRPAFHYVRMIGDASAGEFLMQLQILGKGLQ